MGPQSRVPVEEPSGEPWSPQGPGARPVAARPEEPWMARDREPPSLWLALLFVVVALIGAVILARLLGWY